MKKIGQIIFFVFIVVNCFSATYYSKVSSGTDANTLSNWSLNADGSGGAPASWANTFVIQNGHTMIMSATWGAGSASMVVTINSGGTLDLNGQTLSSTMSAFNVAGTGNGAIGAIMNGSATAATCQEPVILSASATVIASSGDITFSGQFTGTGFTLTVDGTYNVSTVGINLSTAGAFVKNGTGTVTVTATCNYTGTCTVNAGTFAVGVTTQAFGTSASTTTVASGACIDLNGVANSTAEAITISGTGISSGGAITNSSATLGSLAATFTLGAHTSIKTTSGDITLSGTIANAGFDLTVAGTNIATLSGVISGAGGIVKNNSGTLIVSAQSTYTGAVTVNNGIIKLGATGSGNNTPLGAVGATVTVNSGGALDIVSYTLTRAVTLTINGTGYSSSGALYSSSGSPTFSGPITLGSASTITGSGTTMTLTGGITNGGYDLTINGSNAVVVSTVAITGSGSLIKSGSGSLTLSVANTFTGGVSLTAGTLKLGNATCLGTVAGTFAITAGTTIDNSSGGTLTMTNNYPITMNSFTFTGTNSLVFGSGNITLGSSTTITSGHATNTLTLGGIIDDGASTYNFATAGSAGDIILTAANTYGGTTTVGSSSTLKLGAAGVIPDASAITVTGTLDMNSYSETVGSITGVGIIDGTSGSPILTCGGDNTSTTYSGTLVDAAGTLNLTKTGSGTLTLSNASSSFSGTTTVSSGILKLGVAGGATNTPLGTTGGNTVVSSGASLDMNGYNITTTESLTINGTGVSSVGALTNSSTTAVTWPGTIALNDATNNYIGTSGNATTGTLTVSGVISGANPVQIVNTGGTASSVIFSGNNTFSAALTIISGKLRLGATGSGGNTPLGTVTGLTTVNSGAALDLVSYTLTAAEPVTINGTGYSSSGALFSSSGSPTFSGPITLGSVSTITSSGTTLTLSGGITNGGYNLTFDGSGTTIVSTTAITGNGGLIMVGSGTTRISVACTYTGTTTISAGRLENGASNVFPNTGLILSGGTYGNALVGAAGTSYTETFGTLTLSASSTIDFATTSTTQDLIFSNSSGIGWTGILTITDWSGTVGISGTKGQIFFGSDATGLTSTQCQQIVFDTYSGDASHIASGEFAPASTIYYYKSVANGNWSDIATWQRSADGSTGWMSASQYPTSSFAYTITINNNVAIDLTLTMDEVTVVSGATLTNNSSYTNTIANGTGTDLTIDGTYVNDGSITATGTISVSSTGTYNHANGTSLPTTMAFGTNGSAGTLIVSGSATATNLVSLTGAYELYNVTWSSSGAMPTGQSGAGSATLCNGDFTMSNGTWTVVSSGSGSTSTVTVGGNLIVSGGTLTLTITTGSQGLGILEVVGNVSLSSGTLNLSSGLTATYSKLNITGNFTHSGGTLSNTSSGTPCYVIFKGGGTTQTFDASAGATYTDIDFHVGASASTTATVQLASNVIVGAGSTFKVNTTTGNTGTLIIPASYVISGAGTFTTSSGSILKVANVNGIYSSTATGAIQTTTRTFDGACNYHYNGSAAQVTGTGLPTTLTTPGGLTIVNTEIVNSSNTGVTLTQATTVSTGTVTLTSGILTTATGTLLTITNTSTSAISNGFVSTYVNGPLKWTVQNTTATYVFPTGKNGVYYPYTLVSYTSGTSQAPTVEAFAGSTGGTPPSNFTLSTVAYWKVIYSANAFTGAIIKIDESASITGKSAIGYCTTVSGTYTSMGGSNSGTTITSTTATGSLNNVTHFYVMMGVGIYYKRAGTGNWTSTSSWSSTSGGTADIGGYPSGTGNVVIDGNSGDLVIDAAVDGTDLTILNAYTGTISGTGSLSLAGNLTLGSGMTAWTHTGGITFTGSGKTITSNSKSLSSSVTINASGSITLGDAMTTTSNVTLTAGTLSLSSYNLSLAGNLSLASGATFTPSTGTVTFTGSSSAINGTNATPTFYNLVLNKTAGQTLSTGGSVTAITCNNNFTQTTGNFTAPATMTVSAAMTLTAGTFTAPLSTLYIATSFSNNGATFTNNSGTVTFTGTGTLGGSSSTTFYNLIKSTGGTTTLGIAQTVANDLTISGGTLAASTFDLTVGGNWVNNGTFNAGSGKVAFNGSSNKTVTGSSATAFYDLEVDKGTSISSVLEVTVPASITHNCIFTNGLLKLSHSSITASDVVTATTDISATSGLHINGATYSTSSNAVLNNSGYFRVTSGTATIGTASDNTTYNESSTSVFILDGGTVDCYGRFRAAAGSVTISSGTLTIGTGSIDNIATRGGFEIETGSDFSMTGGTVVLKARNPNATGNDLYIVSGGSKSITGGTFQIGNASTVASRIFKINSDISLYNLTIYSTNLPTGILEQNTTVLNNFTNSGIFDANSLGPYNLTIGGGFTNNGTFTAQTGTVVFNGSAAQTISGTTDPAFYNLTVNNTSTGLSLGLNTSITNILTLTSGLLKTVSYTLSLGIPGISAGTISGAGSSSYIVAFDNSGTIGYFKRYTTSTGVTYELPIGDATNYLPVNLNYTSATLSNAYLTTYTKGSKVTGLNSSISNYINRYWDITSSGASSYTYTVDYTFVGTDVVGSKTGMLPVKKSGTTWYKPTGSAFTTGTAQGTGSFDGGFKLTWSGLTSFSLFGGAVEGGVALPIELLSFDAKPYNKDVIVKWETASEINNDYFLVERSTDGNNFKTIANIDGAGNSTYKISYFMIDQDFEKAINYYRLRQVDFNGSETFSNIVAVDMTNHKGTIVMTVNTLGQEVNESYSGVVFDIYSDGTSVKRIK